MDRVVLSEPRPTGRRSFLRLVDVLDQRMGSAAPVVVIGLNGPRRVMRLSEEQSTERGQNHQSRRKGLLHSFLHRVFSTHADRELSYGGNICDRKAEGGLP